MFSQLEQEDIRKVISINQKFDLSKKDAARVVYAQLDKNPSMFKTEIGSRFKKILAQIITGKSTYLACVVCGGKMQGRSVVCNSCIGQLQSPVANRTEVEKPSQTLPATKPETFFCQVCGKPVDGLAEICMQCGCNPTNGHEYCCNCGNTVNSQSTYCMKCGCIPTRKVVTKGRGDAKGKDMVKLMMKASFLHIIHVILNLIIVMMAYLSTLFYEFFNPFLLVQVIVGFLVILVALKERKVFWQYNTGTQWFIILDAFFYFAMFAYLLVQESAVAVCLPIIGLVYIFIGKKKVM
jgi:hypothetical protein